MAKRIVLCFDGTWNTPDEGNADTISSETNVVRFHASVPKGVSPDGVEQLAYYYRGVGTSWFERFTGGGLGVGVSRTMMQGYKDLSETYEAGDRAFLLGFSRGAYTARALAGVMSRCGLLQTAHARRAGRPDDPNLAADDPMLMAYQHWTRRGRDADERRRLQDAVDAFKASYCRPARIAFLGVWDTVGALGIPGRIFQRFNEGLVEFADRDLSGIVDRAYHAVALDEHRDEYAATLWERRTAPGQGIEQCWVPGDHCDVGGGHEIRPGGVRLADVPLAWMQDKARSARLVLAPVAPDLAACSGVACHDTYLEFLGGTWAAGHPRHLRSVGRTPDGGEIVHESVLVRRRADPRYRPANPGLPPL
jgi:uncharacterized protein (DUF2235 family)